MKKQSLSHSISGAFVFLLLGMFALFATVMVLLGARAYQGATARADAHRAERIGPAYLRSMLRSQDLQGALQVETLDQVNTIALLSTYDDESFVTRLYVYEGALREWFTSAEEPFDPGMGEIVCAAEDMTVSVSPGLLTVQLLTGGQWHRVDCALYAANP